MCLTGMQLPGIQCTDFSISTSPVAKTTHQDSWTSEIFISHILQCFLKFFLSVSHPRHNGQRPSDSYSKYLFRSLLSDKMSTQHMGCDVVFAAVLGDWTGWHRLSNADCTARHRCNCDYLPFHVCYMYKWNSKGR